MNLIRLQKQPPEVFYKKRCSKNVAKFTGKRLCQSLFLNKTSGQNTSGRLLGKLKSCISGSYIHRKSVPCFVSVWCTSCQMRLSCCAPNSAYWYKRSKSVYKNEFKVTDKATRSEHTSGTIQISKMELPEKIVNS